MPPKRNTRAAVAQKTPEPAAPVKTVNVKEVQNGNAAVNGSVLGVIKKEECGAGDGKVIKDWADDSLDNSLSEVKTEEENGTDDKVTDNGEMVENDVDDKKKAAKSAPRKTNIYTCLDREEFVWEQFKVEICGLPRGYYDNQLKELLNRRLRLDVQSLNPTKPGSTSAYVCFANETKREKALRVLNNFIWRGNKLSASKVARNPEPRGVKRKAEEEAGAGDDEAKKQKTELSIDEQLQEKLTPLASKPYEEQLKEKGEELKKALTKMSNAFVIRNRFLRPWLREQKEKLDGLPFELTEVRAAPVVDGGCNKFELSVGVNPENQEWTVGSRLTTIPSGSLGVAPIENLKHMPQAMKDAAKLFQKFVRESGKAPYDVETFTGYWRHLSLRTSSEGSLLLTAVIHPQDLKQEELVELKEKLKDFFENGEGKAANVTSLYFLAYGKKGARGTTPTIEHLSGDIYIWENVKGKLLRISPESFFQVNAATAELMCDVIQELASCSGEDVALLDVCSGAGTLSLALSESFGQVVGVEVVPESIEDANYNITNNEVTNCTFFAGKADEALTSALDKIEKPNCLVVIDPPKTGLIPKAVKLLRASPKVNKIIYFSSDLDVSSRYNIMDLCRSANVFFTSNPFVPVKAIPIDTFPHTSNCQIAVLLERLEKLPELSAEDLEEEKKESKTRDGSNKRWRQGWRRGSGRRGGRGGGRDGDARAGMQNRRPGPYTGPASGRFGRDGGGRRRPDNRYGMERGGFGRRAGPPPLPFFHGREQDMNRFEPTGHQDQRMAFAMEALRRFDEEMERRRTAEELIVRAHRPPLMPPKGRGLNRRRMSREDFTRDTLPLQNSFDQAPRSWARGGRRRDRM